MHRKRDSIRSPLALLAGKEARRHRFARILRRRERRARRRRHLMALVDAAERQVLSSLPPSSRKSRRALFWGALTAVLRPQPAYAASDPAGVVSRTTDFLLNLLMGVGICFIAFGVLSLAISFQSHDDSQKSRAVMAIMGGAIAVSVRYVIQIVAPNAGISV